MGSAASTYEVHSGLLHDEAVALFRRFYSRENGRGMHLQHLQQSFYITAALYGVDSDSAERC
jgi:hypothetical protein